MSPAASSESEPRAAAAGGGENRWLLIAILGVSAAPLLAALAVFQYWPPDRKMNYGDLIEPRPLPATPLEGAGGWAQMKGRWVLVTADKGSCAEACRKKLYCMRQVRLSLGPDMNRVERVWLVTDDAPIDQEIMLAFQGTRVVRASGSALLAQFPSADSVQDHIYVVDPLGNLMLRFPRNPDPGRVRKDLDRLLRVSRVG